MRAFLQKWFSFDWLVTPRIIRASFVVITILVQLGALVVIGTGVYLMCGGHFFYHSEYQGGVLTGLLITLRGIAGFLGGPIVIKILSELVSIPFVIIHKLDRIIETQNAH